MFLEISRLSTSSSHYSAYEPKTHLGQSGTGTVVLRSHTGKPLWRYWIHLAAIAVTGALAAINITSLFLLDSNYANAVTVINAFQFAAKLHEVLIVGSMMLILMDSVRDRLLTTTGLPFGLLLSPILFNDLDWLTSHQFWSALKPTRSSLPLTVLILTSIPFANVAGPLSAITVVPRPGWSSTRPAMIFPTFWNSSAAKIWPDTFSADSLPTGCLAGTIGTLLCPGDAIKAVDATFNPEVASSLLCTITDNWASCNSSIGEGSQRDISVEYNRQGLTAYAATPPPVIYEVLSDRMTAGLASLENMTDVELIDARKTQLIEARFVGDTQMLKPASKVVCEDLSYSQIYETFQDFKITTNWTTPLVHWLHDVDDSPGPNFLFTYLRNDPLLDAHISCVGQECYAATSCSITARWVPVRIFQNTAQPSFIYHSHPQPQEIFDSKTIKSAIPVTLKRDWLAAFTVPEVVNITQSLQRLLNVWGPPIAGTTPDGQGESSVANFNPGNYSQAISVFVSSVITEAMGRSSLIVGDSIYSGNCADRKPGFAFSSRICDQDQNFWVHTNNLGEVAKGFSMAAFTVRNNGYGWFIESLTVMISLGILLLHAFLTLIYVIACLAFRKTITTCWSSAPEMLMLALDSFRAPVFMGSSAKATHRDLWTEPVSVREVDDGDRVSLVVGNPNSYTDRLGGLPILGKKYN